MPLSPRGSSVSAHSSTRARAARPERILRPRRWTPRRFRLSTELVAGVFVGAVIGWFLDRTLGISPWGLIVFVLLGFAAGVLNVIRGAGLGSGWPENRPKN